MEVLGGYGLHAAGLLGRRRGVALATALMVSLLLIILAMSMLAFAQRDNDFEMRMEHEVMADAMARAGLEYYKVESEQFGPGTVKSKVVSKGNLVQSFTVSTDTNGTVTSVGSVTTQIGRPLAQKTLVAPMGDMTRIFDTSL